MKSTEIIKKYEFEKLLSTKEEQIRWLMTSIDDATKQIDFLDSNINEYTKEILEFIQTKVSKIEVMEICKEATLVKRNELKEQLLDVKRTK